MDNTSSENLKAKIKELESQLEIERSANENKTNFLAFMSHEIRTPMNGIVGLTELTLDTDLDSLQRDYLMAIRYSCNNLLVIVNDILDFSKIEAGKIELDLIHYDFRKLIQKSIQILQKNAQDKKIYLCLNIDENIPENIEVDPVRTRQVILNLVNNAIKFTDKGGVTIDVKCECLQLSSYKITTSVKDTGVGIRDVAIQNLFNNYSQAASSTTRNHGGTGLGLVISRKLSKLMGGDVVAESEYGKGSTFTFTFCCKKTNVEPKTIPSIVRPFSEAGVHDYHILLVEDNLISQKVIRSLLTKLGCKVDIANNGREAIDMLNKKYDLIFMDCNMPDMDGYEATARIRKNETGNTKHIIVALTACVMDKDKKRCFAAGMDDFVAKPILVKNIIAVLRKWLDPNHEKQAV